MKLSAQPMAEGELMPRGKSIKIPSPADIAKKLAKEQRLANKELEQRRKELILHVGPLLEKWDADEAQKSIANSVFKTEEEQDWICAELNKSGWSAESHSTGITVQRPQPQPKAKAPAKKRGMRRAGADPK